MSSEFQKHLLDNSICTLCKLGLQWRLNIHIFDDDIKSKEGISFEKYFSSLDESKAYILQNDLNFEAIKIFDEEVRRWAIVTKKENGYFELYIGFELNKSKSILEQGHIEFINLETQSMRDVNLKLTLYNIHKHNRNDEYVGMEKFFYVTCSSFFRKNGPIIMSMLVIFTILDHFFRKS